MWKKLFIICKLFFLCLVLIKPLPKMTTIAPDQQASLYHTNHCYERSVKYLLYIEPVDVICMLCACHLEITIHIQIYNFGLHYNVVDNNLDRTNTILVPFNI